MGRLLYYTDALLPWGVSLWVWIAEVWAGGVPWDYLLNELCRKQTEIYMQEKKYHKDTIMWGRTAIEGVFWRVPQVCVTTFYCVLRSSFWGIVCQTLTWQDSVFLCWVRDSVVCHPWMYSRTLSFCHTWGEWKNWDHLTTPSIMELVLYRVRPITLPGIKSRKELDSLRIDAILFMIIWLWSLLKNQRMQSKYSI